ncbi:MAG: proprotein convertase P-domain-containing protein [Phycisphaerales bacterium]|nr:proprotein convertase P-domain-containing protein [Phycisphaerales bacterium]
MIRFLLIAALASTQYVQAQTHCGTGASSIPDGSSSTVWFIDVPSTDQIITDIKVLTQIAHPWIGDLSMRLTAPNGTSVLLLDRPGMPDGGWVGPWGCGGNDIACLFDDSAPSAAESTCALDVVPVLNGNLAPLESLAALNGQVPSGRWILEVSDHSFIDAGAVEELCLTFSTAPDCNQNGIADSIDIGTGQSNDFDEDGIPDECQCTGDTNGDLIVDVSDVLRVLEEWGCTSDCTADITGDSIVNVSDLLVVIDQWGVCL